MEGPQAAPSRPRRTVHGTPTSVLCAATGVPAIAVSRILERHQMPHLADCADPCLSSITEMLLSDARRRGSASCPPTFVATWSACLQVVSESSGWSGG